MKEVTTAALIPAAGNGLRLGEGPKALLRLGDRTLLEIVVAKLKPLVDEVLVAAPEGYEEEFQRLIHTDGQVITGGKLRKESVERLAKHSNAETLLIQNVASPFASAQLLKTVLNAAVEHGAAGAFLSPTVPIARISQDQACDYWDRSEAGYFQTPQAFSREILLSSYQRAQNQCYQSTAQYVMNAGFPLVAITGEIENIKITSELDWQIAKHVLAFRLGVEGTSEQV